MKKNYGYWIKAAGLAGCLCLSIAACQSGAPKGAMVVSQVDVTAEVTKINYKTREVTLKATDGREASFIADAAVKNLDQVKKGDVVAATYTEALAYEVVKQSGKPGVESIGAAAGAAPGTKPAGVIGQNTTVTVAITAIDAKAPSVTFKGPDGDKKTVKVASADKLQGVSVGDTVAISYTEAVAFSVTANK
jgi:hypothetical protein